MATYDLTSSIPASYLLVTGDILNCPYSGNYKTLILPKGKYKLEVWGAQGGSFNTTYYGGKGGYATGILNLSNELTTLYLYAGGQGTNGTTSGTFAGGWNGGGQAYTSSATYDMSAGGGGSDIRIGSTSLYARVIVAGGGGGAGSYSSSYRYAGGAGGGTSGVAGGQYSTSYKAGQPGTATGAGISYYGTTSNSTSYFTVAGFGTGGAAISSSYCSGGGGGWYGGGGARRASGGGGSGYVYTSSTASQYPSGCLLNSSYYLESASTSAGSASFIDYSGSSVTGHSGNGACRITAIEIYEDVFEKYDKNYFLKTTPNNSLPSSYVELPYIECDGTQCINTNFNPNNNTSIKLDFELLNISQTSGFFGGRDNTQVNVFGAWFTTANTFCPHYGNVSYNTYPISIPDGSRRIYQINKDYASTVGTIKKLTTATFQSSYPLYLFSMNSGGTIDDRKVKGRLYSCQLYDNGTLIRNFIPALRISDYKAGLYDIVNSTFYSDAAGGNFIYNRYNYIDNNTIYYIKGDSATTNLGKSGTITNSGVTISDNSLYFNGSSKLSLSNNVCTGTNDFTIEWWEYFNSAQSSAAAYHSNAGTDTGFGLLVGHYNPTDKSYVYASSTGSSWDVLNAFSLGTTELNKWTHRALVRKGSTFYGFKNGKLTSTATSSLAIKATLTPTIGGYRHTSDTYYNGYLKHFRISSCARYTSDFIPPELDIAQGTNYTKISTSYLKTSSQPYSGYTLLPYLEKVTGTEYVDSGFTPNQNTRVVIDFELTKTTTGQEAIFGGRTAYQSNMFSVFTKTNNIGFQNDYGAIDDQKNIIPCPANQRFVIDKNKNVFTVNNRVIHTHAATTFTATNNLLIGSCTQNSGENMATSYPSYMKIYSCKIYDNGTLIRDYIPAMRNSDLKLGLYDKQNNKFYPEATGNNFVCNNLDIDAATVYLLNGELQDETGKIITNNSVAEVPISYLNNKCLYFNGSSRIFLEPYNFGSNDFTIDWWEYVTNSSSETRFCSSYTSSNYGGLLLGYNGTLTYASSNANGTNWDLTSAVKMIENTLNTWVHWAFVRKGTTLTSYKNGKKYATTTINGAIGYSSSLKMCLGDYRSGDPSTFIGYIDSFRISNIARWANDFTPPTQSYGFNWKEIKEIYIKRNPSTAEPKKSPYDSTIYTESDGSKWIRIFHHNNPASYLFASTDDFTKDVYKDANRWASLYLLKDLDVKEVMLKQCLTSGATVSSFRWYQPKNPIDSTWNDDAQGSCTFHSSYTAPSTNYGGLHLHKTNTYIACHNATQSNWFGAIGSWTAHNSGSPGYNGTTITTGYMDLYIPYKDPEEWVKI